eukprot:CAMPEP_0201511672 /NCGR_PEP_ID=MMETSP0161_2-20130828/4091_1 /ASSEMBLY_ACC=CAM_ASM_000251 /TAXON_ID=180227 /ORGANISM="Neoparamoeba aestuarina, Strain SoJaBio B1-5/56/2" /LENGTH=362 /DNA_ID=CAMNT_0047907257 /DNA_START=262 /DNA_END=1350 /DNA_ORIENTATION=+
MNRSIFLAVSAGAAYFGYRALVDYTEEESHANTCCVALPSQIDEGYRLNRTGLFLYTREWAPKEEHLYPSLSSSPSSPSSSSSSPEFTPSAPELTCVTMTTPPRKAKGVVFIVHGMAEHCNRYSHVAALFNALGFYVHSLDNQGFGRSQGDRAYARSFNDFIDDYYDFVNETMLKYEENTPMFLVGHSMGGLIGYQVAARQPERWAGVIFSGFCYKLPPHVAPPHLKFVAAGLSSWLPKGSLPVSTLNLDEICSDPSVVQHARDDQWYEKGPVSFRLASELFTTIDNLPNVTPSAKFPVLFMHGKDDVICLPEGSEFLYSSHPHEDREIHIFDKMFHEIFNEFEKDQVMTIMSKWVLARTPK